MIHINLYLIIIGKNPTIVEFNQWNTKKNIIKAQLNLYYKHLYISSKSKQTQFFGKLIFAFKKMLINTENAKTRNTTHSNIPID